MNGGGWEYVKWSLVLKMLYTFEIYREGASSALSFKVGISTVGTHTRSYYLLQAGGECFCVFQCVVLVLTFRHRASCI